jgi:hypothetical protein
MSGGRYRDRQGRVVRHLRRRNRMWVFVRRVSPYAILLVTFGDRRQSEDFLLRIKMTEGCRWSVVSSQLLGTKPFSATNYASLGTN